MSQLAGQAGPDIPTQVMQLGERVEPNNPELVKIAKGIIAQGTRVDWPVSDVPARFLALIPYVLPAGVLCLAGGLGYLASLLPFDIPLEFVLGYLAVSALAIVGSAFASRWYSGVLYWNNYQRLGGTGADAVLLQGRRFTISTERLGRKMRVYVGTEFRFRFSQRMLGVGESRQTGETTRTGAWSASPGWWSTGSDVTDLTDWGPVNQGTISRMCGSLGRDFAQRDGKVAQWLAKVFERAPWGSIFLPTRVIHAADILQWVIGAYQLKALLICLSKQAQAMNAGG